MKFCEALCNEESNSQYIIKNLVNNSFIAKYAKAQLKFSLKLFLRRKKIKDFQF